MTKESLYVNKVWIASDHAGLELKNYLKSQFPEWGFEDLGVHNTNSVDYPDYGDLLSKTIQPVVSMEVVTQHFGILVCGSGQGMAMRANRYPFIRAALCWDEESTKLSRQHNDANVLCLGGRLLDHSVAVKILKAFVDTPFEKGRHVGRVQKLGRPLC